MAAEPQRIKSISEFHQLANIARPEHPLISVINMENVKSWPGKLPSSRMLDFYTISLKRNCHGHFKYGQQQYDAQGGVFYFIAPGQVFSSPVKHEETKPLQTEGWGLFIHPDFLWNTPLAKKIKKYAYFDYAVNEALWPFQSSFPEYVAVCYVLSTL